MNRREFGKTAVVVAVTGPAILSLEGCPSSTVIADINVVLQEAENVLAVIAPNAPWFADLKAAITALRSAEASWQSGSTVQLVIDALNTIVAVTAVIPVTAPYSALIAVLVAAIEAVLVLLPQSSNAVGVKATSIGNPYIGQYQIKHHFLHSPAGDFKVNWNDVAKAHGLTQAVIK